MILSVCLSPGLQRTVTLDALTPGEVNRLQSVAVDVAGKGVNVCRVLQALGTEAICLAQGGDNAADVLALARREHLNLHLIPSSGALRTCTTVIELSSATGGRRVTELVEPCAAVSHHCAAEMTEAFNARLPQAQALVIAGSMAPGFPAHYQTTLALAARAAGVPVALDLQGDALRDAMRGRPALVKINLSEFAATFLDAVYIGGEHHGLLAAETLPDTLLAAVSDVSAKHPDTCFVLTRGARDILSAYRGDVRARPVPALAPQQTLSTIGCGDTFLAGLLARLLSFSPPGLGEDIAATRLGDAIDFATRCAQSSARTLHPGHMDPATRPTL